MSHQTWLQEMVERIDWFVDADYEILKYLLNHDVEVDSSKSLIVTPKTMGIALDYDHNYMGKRLRLLRDAGLLNQHGHGLYELSDDGKKFLQRNISAEEIEKRDPTS